MQEISKTSNDILITVPDDFTDNNGNYYLPEIDINELTEYVSGEDEDKRIIKDIYELIINSYEKYNNAEMEECIRSDINFEEKKISNSQIKMFLSLILNRLDSQRVFDLLDAYNPAELVWLTYNNDSLDYVKQVSIILDEYRKSISSDSDDYSDNDMDDQYNGYVYTPEEKSNQKCLHY